jgi:putative FmdB family regulatory protein
MPLYGFHCADCNAEFEALVGSSEVPACPTCGSETLEKLLSRVAPEAKSPALIKQARACAACEGHFSNYCPAERPS